MNDNPFGAIPEEDEASLDERFCLHDGEDETQAPEQDGSYDYVPYDCKHIGNNKKKLPKAVKQAKAKIAKKSKQQQRRKAKRK